MGPWKIVRGSRARTPQEPLEIVGIVGDVRHEGLDAGVHPEIYFPTRQKTLNTITLLVRSDLPPIALERAIQTVDPDLPVEIRPLAENIRESLARRRFGTVLIALFGAIAMTLAAVGIYGVMSYSVVRRKHEIGIRMALGASRQAVLGLIVGEGWRMTALGVVAGLGLAAAGSRWLEGLLFELSPLDPLSFAAVAVVLLLVSTIAAFLPAQKATGRAALTELLNR